MFKARLNENGMKGSIYYDGAMNKFSNSNYRMPNCTAYVYGRLCEMMNQKPDDSKLKTGNAQNWYPNTTYPKGQVPKLGAIICYQGKNTGHIGIVEQIKANGDIVVSQSEWQGAYFRLTTHTKVSGYKSLNPILSLQGFIYVIPDIVEPVTIPKPAQKMLYLPASAQSWRVYPLNKPARVGNECGFLKPSKFGGLQYEILGYPYKDVVTIQTRDFGKVNIYVHPSTLAVIK